MQRELFNNMFRSVLCNRPFEGSHEADGAHSENEFNTNVEKKWSKKEYPPNK